MSASGLINSQTLASAKGGVATAKSNRSLLRSRCPAQLRGDAGRSSQRCSGCITRDPLLLKRMWLLVECGKLNRVGLAQWLRASDGGCC